MPTPTKGARLGGSPSHQRLILANLATALFEHGRITTTEAKARRLRPYAEQLITKAKTDTVANRRQVVKVVRDKSVLHTLFTEIGPAMATRPGGYTRITKIGPRKGDNAPMAVIEIVEAQEFATQATTPKRDSAAAAAPAETPAEDESTVEATDEAPAETDVVAGAPASEAEAEPATEAEVEAAAEAATGDAEAPAEDASGDESQDSEKA